MTEIFNILTPDHPILSTIFVISMVVELICIVVAIAILIRVRHDHYGIKDGMLSGVGLIMLLFFIPWTISAHKLQVANDKNKEKEFQDASYLQAVEEMGDGQWYEAAINFNNSGGQNNAEVLRDYCYYVYLSEEHPDWVPWMGLNEITGECN